LSFGFPLFSDYIINITHKGINVNKKTRKLKIISDKKVVDIIKKVVFNG